MRRPILLALGLLAVWAPIATADTPTELISVGIGGVPANFGSGRGLPSADGRFVVFNSLSSNMVVGDVNAIADVFVRDRLLGVTQRVSVSGTGDEANGASNVTDISPDGRYVVFESLATNLAPGDTNGVKDVFVRDLQAGTTTRVSVSSTGAQANGVSNGGQIDSTRRVSAKAVVFQSDATNLVNGKPLGGVFRHDLVTGKTKRIKLPVGVSGLAGMSSTDKVIGAFTVVGRDREQVVFDRKHGTVSPPCTYADCGFALSDDGSTAVFHATHGEPFSYVYSIATGATEVFALSSDGQSVGVDSAAMPDDDGQRIVWDTYEQATADDEPGTDIFLRDRVHGTTVRVDPLNGMENFDELPSISRDGTLVTWFDGTNGQLYARVMP